MPVTTESHVKQEKKQASPRSRRPGLATNLLLSMAALLFFLLAAEFIIRPVKGYPLLPLIPPAPYVDRARLYQETPNRLYELRPNVVSKSTEPDIIINSLGMRDREYGQKSADVFRVAALGDSFTFAGGVPAAQAYDKRLEALLNEATGRHRYEVLNFGVPGYNSERELYMLQEKALPLQPDLVLVGFVLNDVLPKTTLVTGKRLLPVSVREGFKRSKLFLTAYEAFSRTRDDRLRLPGRETAPLSEDGAGWADARNSLKRMKDLTDARGIGLVVVIFPMFEPPIDETYPFKGQHETVLGACREFGIECLDLRDSYTGYSPKQLMLSRTDGHPSVLAHQIAASAIFGFLRTSGMLATTRADGGQNPTEEGL